MPVVKGGVWTNIEDEILKASVSKYGLNQWARVSSLLARKTAKQCKARWAEWLDPGIRKVEWSREEDEKLLHLAKLMPTQWRTIAPIVGRTATQCLERYQRLLDEAEARENDEFGLGGPAGGEGAAPSADDVRKLRPGEVDPDPESKPARPDTIDMDEDEKEMLSEARARLANTQGKKAKRKARERQLEESRRLAVLQKRRELKASGINIKITTVKKGQMDYNADIPFEKAPAPGFYDTQEEMASNEVEREAYDPRKQQLANKRKGDGDGDDGPGKRQKKNKDSSGQEALAAAAKASQLAKLRQAEQTSKRRGLNLPAPQVSDAEMDDIVKVGMLGERANRSVQGENESTRGLVGDYSNQIAMTPIRTPRAPQEEDRIANEVRNARLRTGTQSALLGGDNADIDETGTTGYTGAAPSKNTFATPNPLATPYRQANGTSAGPSATPMRTPRDTFRLNAEDGTSQLVPQTPRDMRIREQVTRENLRAKLSSLPKPKETEWELELPEDQQDSSAKGSVVSEDSSARDRRLEEERLATARAAFKRESQVVQRGLPRPAAIDTASLTKAAQALQDPIQREIALGATALMAHDARAFGAKISGRQPTAPPLLSEEEQMSARLAVMLELNKVSPPDAAARDLAFSEAWSAAHCLPGLEAYSDEPDAGSKYETLLVELTSDAQAANAVEARLQKLHGGYIARSGALRAKIVEAAAFLARTREETETAAAAHAAEQLGLRERLDRLRDEVTAVNRREREGQERYRTLRAELEGL